MFNVGDRVYYKDNGPDDLGTIVEVFSPDDYKVSWDDEYWGVHGADQLCLEGVIPGEPLYECEE